MSDETRPTDSDPVFAVGVSAQGVYLDIRAPTGRRCF
jgi:hypothetical protein